MSFKNTRIDKNFEKVTKVNIVLTLIENIAFFALGKWDYTVLLGSLWGLGMTTLFFFMICISVPRALALQDPDMAANAIKASQLKRTAVLAVGIVIAIKFPHFYWPAALIPLLFTRISIFTLHLDREEE
ncbi:MAG: hypothetical protein IJ410_00400 [Oscillospiraceae bacterium]|nr:hypothetical protein [Oscillospiraceae bacterium]